MYDNFIKLFDKLKLSYEKEIRSIISKDDLDVDELKSIILKDVKGLSLYRYHYINSFFLNLLLNTNEISIKTENVFIRESKIKNLKDEIFKFILEMKLLPTFEKYKEKNIQSTIESIADIENYVFEILFVLSDICEDDEFNKIIKFFEMMISDKMLSDDKYLALILKYLEVMGEDCKEYVYSIAQKVKIDKKYLDILVKYSESRNNISEIILMFINNFFLIPTKEQILEIVSKKNKLNKDLILKLNLKFDDAAIILDYLRNGIYPIPNISQKQILNFTDYEKKKINEVIFNNYFTLSQIMRMEKQFGLIFDNECVSNFCKNNSDKKIFEYLISKDIVPDGISFSLFLNKLHSYSQIKKGIDILLKYNKNKNINNNNHELNLFN